MSRLALILIPLAATVALAGCYGKQLVREPISVDETREDVRAMRRDIAVLKSRSDSLDHVLRAYRSDQGSLRTTMEVQLVQVQEEVRALSVQVQELMALMATRAPSGARAYPSPDVGGRPSWEPPPPTDSASGTPWTGDSSGDADDGGSTPDDAPRDARTPADRAPGTTADRGPGATAAPTSARELYDGAYLDLTKGNYQLALMGFRDFLKQYADTDLADNAQYWIGEVYYAQSQYDQAIEEFLRVVDEYAEADKVPAAYLKTAFSFRQLGDLPTARRYLRLIMDRYPDTEEARLARQNLAELR